MPPTKETVPVITLGVIRPEVEHFAKDMEDQLIKNDDERGDSWKEIDPEYLWRRLGEQLDPLQDLLEDTKGAATAEQFDAIALRLRAKAADAANFLMFLAEYYDPTSTVKIS